MLQQALERWHPAGCERSGRTDSGLGNWIWTTSQQESEGERFNNRECCHGGVHRCQHTFNDRRTCPKSSEEGPRKSSEGLQYRGGHNCTAT